MSRIGRRDFVLTGAAFAGLAALAGCAREEQDASGEAPPETPGADPLAALIFDMFPHQALYPSVYGEIADSVRASLAVRADWPALQEAGVAALNAAAGGDWTALSYETRAAATKTISATPFFRTVYQAALIEFYSHRQVWALVGYPGSSAEFGGYLDRGFDDIDWLPENAP